MKILFIDPINWEYDTQTPYNQPLGGGQSCTCYLSAELAKLGHEVAIINHPSRKPTTDGVNFIGAESTMQEINSYDVVILCNDPRILTMREHGFTGKAILWVQHAIDQAGIAPLADKRVVNELDGLVMVTKYQAFDFCRAFSIPWQKVKILRNCASPAFMDITHSAVEGQKVLAYTSTPFRGLELLLLAFPMIRKAIPGITLRVFSAMSLYRMSAEQDYCAALYDMARDLPGVEYYGAVGQRRLAEEMSTVDVWAYPCTFPEMACISAMEAMAAGAQIITTGVAAMPETLSGFGNTMNFTGVQNPGLMATQFAQHAIEVLKEPFYDTADQISFARANYNWSTRAPEWVEYLEGVVNND
jgi:glycosyltransferase involved in cell wall biosynthesis